MRHAITHTAMQHPWCYLTHLLSTLCTALSLSSSMFGSITGISQPNHLSLVKSRGQILRQNLTEISSHFLSYCFVTPWDLWEQVDLLILFMESEDARHRRSWRPRISWTGRKSSKFNLLFSILEAFKNEVIIIQYKEWPISPRNLSEIVIVILFSGCECWSNCQEAHQVQSPSACGPAIENTHCTQARVCLRLTWMESATTPRSPAWEIFGAGGRSWEGNWSINNVDRCPSLLSHIVTRMVK